MTGPEAGWYDDGRGRQSWWDGTRWTDAARFSGEERAFTGIVVDGRWIHFGALSEPVASAAASYESGAELVKRGRLNAHGREPQSSSPGRVLSGHSTDSPYMANRIGR